MSQPLYSIPGAAVVPAPPVAADPRLSSARTVGEVLAEKLLEHYRSTGPRGVALVPRERADLLDGLDLPDTALYDAGYFGRDADGDLIRDPQGRLLLERFDVVRRPPA